MENGSHGGAYRPALSRRSFLTRTAAIGVGALAGPALLAACGSGSSAPAVTSGGDLSKILPAYLPRTLIKPDIPGTNGSDPTYLSYPAKLVRSVTETPGAGGRYTAITPLWTAIPPGDGNPYYAAVNTAIGATMTMQPASGTTYQNTLPTLFAGNKLPSWIDIPGYMTQALNFGEAVGHSFTDLTPYLSGDNIKAYPNLAAIPTGAWQCEVWDGKLYGIPSFPSTAIFIGALYYRKDLVDQLGHDARVSSADDLFNLGKQVNDPKSNRWAFNDVFTEILDPFDVPYQWGTDAKGELVFKWESEQIIEAMSWLQKVVAAGMMHPDALAGDTSNAKQRFWSGNVVIDGDGPGAWNGQDAASGRSNNPAYVRMAFDPISASGSGAARMSLGNAAGLSSYLNKSLSPDQVRECLRIANYFAAPYGTEEYTLINYGRQGADWTPSANGPLTTDTGSKYVATTYQFLATGPAVTTVTNGYTDVARDFAAWQASAGKASYKPLFYGMNVSLSSTRLSTALNAQSLQDAAADVYRGRKTVADYRSAIKDWRANGGDDLRKFYDNVRSKYGTGQ